MRNLGWKLAWICTFVVVGFAGYAMGRVGHNAMQDPSCYAFHGQCDPGLNMRFALYACLAMLAVVANFFCIHKMNLPRK
jgi:hypothetical protein